MLPFISAVQKNLQLPVQVPMGFLTRPVTADQPCYDAGHSEDEDDYNSSLHHASVPWMWPKTRAMMTAETNMPVMM